MYVRKNEKNKLIIVSSFNNATYTPFNLKKNCFSFKSIVFRVMESVLTAKYFISTTSLFKFVGSITLWLYFIFYIMLCNF